MSNIAWRGRWSGGSKKRPGHRPQAFILNYPVYDFISSSADANAPRRLPPKTIRRASANDAKQKNGLGRTCKRVPSFTLRALSHGLRVASPRLLNPFFCPKILRENPPTQFTVRKMQCSQIRTSKRLENQNG